MAYFLHAVSLSCQSFPQLYCILCRLLSLHAYDVVLTLTRAMIPVIGQKYQIQVKTKLIDALIATRRFVHIEKQVGIHSYVRYCLQHQSHIPIPICVCNFSGVSSLSRLYEAPEIALDRLDRSLCDFEKAGMHHSGGRGWTRGAHLDMSSYFILLSCMCVSLPSLDCPQNNKELYLRLSKIVRECDEMEQALAYVVQGRTLAITRLEEDERNRLCALGVCLGGDAAHGVITSQLLAQEETLNVPLDFRNNLKPADGVSKGERGEIRSLLTECFIVIIVFAHQPSSQCFDTLKRLNLPPNAYVHARQGILFRNMGCPKQAEECFRTYLEIEDGTTYLSKTEYTQIIWFLS